jgi:hypothetical protein
MNSKIFFAMLASALFSATTYAQISNEDKAFLAGKYWGAVIMADEFKKTNCGKNISIDKKWTDVNAAKVEIFNNFPKSTHSELHQYFTRQTELSTRNEVNEMWAKIPNNKCDGARNIFWNIFDDAVSKWKSAR